MSTKKKVGFGFTVSKKKTKSKARPKLAAFTAPVEESKTLAPLLSKEDLENQANTVVVTEQKEEQCSPCAGTWARLTERAVYLSCRGQYRKAASQYQAAIGYLNLELSDENRDPPVDKIAASKVFEQYAQVLNELSQFMEAIKMATKAVELNPNWAEAHQTLYRAELNWGDPNKALDTAKNAMIHSGDQLRQEIKNESEEIADICAHMEPQQITEPPPLKPPPLEREDEALEETSAKAKANKRSRSMEVEVEPKPSNSRRGLPKKKLTIDQKSVTERIHEKLKPVRESRSENKQAMESLKSVMSALNSDLKIPRNLLGKGRPKPKPRKKQKTKGDKAMQVSTPQPEALSTPMETDA